MRCGACQRVCPRVSLATPCTDAVTSLAETEAIVLDQPELGILCHLALVVNFPGGKPVAVGADGMVAEEPDTEVAPGCIVQAVG